MQIRCTLTHKLNKSKPSEIDYLNLKLRKKLSRLSALMTFKAWDLKIINESDFWEKIIAFLKAVKLQWDFI